MRKAVLKLYLSKVFSIFAPITRGNELIIHLECRCTIWGQQYHHWTLIISPSGQLMSKYIEQPISQLSIVIMWNTIYWVTSTFSVIRSIGDENRNLAVQFELR